MTASEARDITNLARTKGTWVNWTHSKIQDDIKIAAHSGSFSVATVIDTEWQNTEDVDTVAAMLVSDGFCVYVVSNKDTDKVVFNVSW